MSGADSELCDTVQAWMVDEAPTAAHHFFTSSPKVHFGFHYAWHVSGLRQQVMDLVKAKCSEATARKVNVVLTGMIPLFCPVTHTLCWVSKVLCCSSLCKHVPAVHFGVMNVGVQKRQQ